jgi:NAD(P)-dependent dehydrogenase (short-subunit alcohol dehydrogenase family)
MSIAVLKNRSCLITGAASGIGRALSHALGAEGARLILVDIDQPGLLRVADALRQAGASVLTAAALDVSDLQAVRGFADSVHQQHGSVDVLLNVAGISIWGSIESLEHHHFRRVIEVDLMGPIHMIECFVPPMIRAGRGGHIVNVASAAGLFGLPWHAAYSASKFGLRGLSEVLRFDLERFGIGVSLVCPGAVDTGLVETVQIVGVDAEAPALAQLRARFRKRAVRPEQAANAIVRGIKRGRYLVFTSADIRALYWAQGKAHWIYVWVMRRLNVELQELLGPAAHPIPTPTRSADSSEGA